MASLSELLAEYRLLPLGNIYPKQINGKTYHYHQYFQNGRRYSVLLQESEIAPLQEKIQRRKELEEAIRELRSKNKKVTLSKNANELTGQLMFGNTPVAWFKEGKLICYDDERAPFVISRTESIEEFLKLRVIDMSRTNARILKKVLGIHTDEDYKTALFAYALSVSDRYWFRPKNSKLHYEDVAFDNDLYFETAIKGDTTLYPNRPSMTPEITTTGSFEKGWRYIDGTWYLYKTGTQKQIFAELFCSRFARLIGVPTVEYQIEDPWIVCRNFAEKVNFEPMAALAGSQEDYASIFHILVPFSPSIAKDYLRLLFFDSVVYNIDRHNENFGLERNIENGKVLRLAPNFDNNLALTATTDHLTSDISKDGFVRLFVNFLKNDADALALFQALSFPDIERSDIQAICNEIPLDIPGKEELPAVILARYQALKELFNNKHISKVC